MGHYMDDVVDLCYKLGCDDENWRDGKCRLHWGEQHGYTLEEIKEAEEKWKTKHEDNS